MVELLRTMLLAGVGDLWGCLGASHTVGLLGLCSVWRKAYPPLGGGQGILDLNTQPMTGSHLASVSRVLGLQGWTTILEVSLLIFWD